MTNSTQLKTIIIDDFHPVLLEQLKAYNLSFHYLPNLTETEALKVIPQYNVIVVRSKVNFTADLIKSLPNLKCIARGGAGMDNIDEATAQENNIILLNAPEGNRDAVAEHAIGLMLAISNNITKANKEVKNANWQREANRGFEIGGKTIGIIGFGNTGKSLAKKLCGFDCRILSYDKYAPSLDPNVAAVGLQELLSQSDIISLHVPLTLETKWMVDEDFLNQCKHQMVLINTSRGKVVNQLAVLEALKMNKLRGFASDVLENEKFETYTPVEMAAFKALSEFSQVVFTPHIAGWTKESYYKIGDVLASKLIDFTTNLKKY